MNVFARFYDRTIKTNEINPETGLPEFKEVCYCEIRIKNNTTDIVDQPATDEKKQIFFKEYQHYLLAKEKEQAGTKLSLFAHLSAKDIEMLKSRGIFTVEDFNALSKEKAESLNLLAEWQKTSDFLSVYKNMAVLEKLRAENKKLQKEIKALKAKELENKSTTKGASSCK